ncbi:MAG: pyruvate, phosphate dikinase, partial [Candidatus Hydrogenedentes bacterium]|nr:pyruvate, phosphate dikinase [Candidatus Hydrogenedentota bacterium]
MLGNFFMLTCPYLYDLETITYFALLRDNHSIHATTPIAETTQLLLDVYLHNGKIYLHPLKVQHRYSPTMHMLHAWEGDSFLPVTESHTTADVLASAARSPLESASSRLGLWYRTFLHAEQAQAAVKKGGGDPAQAQALFHRMLRMIISRDARVLGLAQKYLTIDDLLEV